MAEIQHTITEFIEYPDHDKRTDSAEFVRNKRILVKQLDLPCWICGSRENREVHHWHEWALWDALDHDKVLDTLHVIDPYGYTQHAGEKPIETPDDIRNLVVLCGQCESDGSTIPGGHHRGVDHGVHDMTMPIWLAQRSVKAGLSITKAKIDIKAKDKKIQANIIAAVKDPEQDQEIGDNMTADISTTGDTP